MFVVRRDYSLLQMKALCFLVQSSTQWRIYIEAKEAVLGGPRTQWAPQIYI